MQSDGEKQFILNRISQKIGHRVLQEIGKKKSKQFSQQHAQLFHLLLSYIQFTFLKVMKLVAESTYPSSHPTYVLGTYGE